MIWNKILLLGVLCCTPLTVVGEWHQDVFYQEINKFRASPTDYQKEHDINILCTVPLEETYPPLKVVQQLENSSYFHASTIASNECPVVSHETCNIFCSQFGSCSFQDRVEWFLHNVPYHNALEIMILGPKDPLKIFHHFLASEAHCNHILNCHINSMGASFVHADRNIFVADFAYVHN